MISLGFLKIPIDFLFKLLGKMNTMHMREEVVRRLRLRPRHKTGTGTKTRETGNKTQRRRWKQVKETKHRGMTETRKRDAETQRR